MTEATPVSLPVNLRPATSLDHASPTSARALAWEILVAASSADSGEGTLVRIRTLLEKSVDWGTLLRLADDHGTSSLLYQNLSRLSGAVSPSALESLQQRHEKNIHKSLFLARELIGILDHLDQLGIAAIPYKGVVLSESYYGDMALRQSGDLDLFVRRRDVVHIKAALRDLGYSTRTVIPDEALKDYIASGYEWTFDSPAGPNLLELQWALQPRFYAVDFDMEGLFQRAVNVTVAGRDVRTPSPEDLLLVLSVHAAKHVWGRLVWLCDIAQILKKENLNWDRVQSLARELGVERILRVTLLLANRLLATTLPTPIESAILGDQEARALADEIAAALAAGVSPDVKQLPYFRLMMRLRERPADRLRFLMRLTFTPGPGEWEAIPLPKPLFPLYRIVRLARLASRFAGG
jgi:putative nucleotidyltransferase-like protein